MNDQQAERLLSILERIAVALEGEKSVAIQSSNRQADRIRHYVKEKYIDPARRRSAKTIAIKAGDISKEMRIKNGQPAVAGALGADKFEKFASVKKISQEGPHAGAKTTFTFQLM